jgi:hypothetical protein
MFLRTFVTVSFMLSSHMALADSLDLNLSDHSVQFAYGRSFRSAEMTVGALYVEKGNNPDSHRAVHLGLIASAERRGTTLRRSEAGLGGRLYFASAGGSDVAALALGGEFRWFPGEGPVSIGGYAYYAPDIVTGIDAKHLWEAGARVELEVVRNTAHVYVGYRKMEMRLENDVDVTVDKGAHFGVRIVF